jgi:hypothetical protein
MSKTSTPLFKVLGLAALLVLSMVIFSACGVNPADSSLNSSVPGVPSSTASSNSNTNTLSTNNSSSALHFNLVPSPNIKACLPKAYGNVTVTPGELNDTMTINVSGLVPDTEYDLFIIQLPNKPFGVAWYQTDVDTDHSGSGSATVRGIFNVETFSVSTGGTTTFAPTHQYHVGLWFNDPNVPFKLGCEPGAKQPIVTPFNGEQHAGIQVLNTSEFPDNAGPLSQLKK